ncbi:hypothetical protein B0T17DRAFT_620256 [Bombardia bombarda]|uniref:VWFA domain-containing protein n=1 Tax=Bombardia bombarda TaxID=252184 RepID=A0AA39WCJ0_9PEZI|nr:hypothetical protein B0T17DRAFT_620256 [Bombardia bombarda]
MSSSGKPSRSIFGSIRDKLSSKNKSGGSKSEQPTIPPPTPRDKLAPTPAGPSVPGAAGSTAGGSRDAPSPPSYNDAVTNPFATTNPTPAPAPAPAIAVSNPAVNPYQRNPSPVPSVISAASLSTPEDPYAFLSSFDTVFLIDDSSSMRGESWAEVRGCLAAITPICAAHDADGIDVFFLNCKNRVGPRDTSGFCNIRTAQQVDDLFLRVLPTGATPTGERINAILKPYLREYEAAVKRTGDPDNSGVKPVNMIVITDGSATDDPESVIISVAKKLDALEAPPFQVGIQFFQVGNERGAKQALETLDDDLARHGDGCRDMVDTVTWSGRDGERKALSGDAILKVVLGAVVKRLDRRRASGESRRRPGHLAP